MACKYGNREIYGIVYDAETQAPVVGARIRIGAIDGQCVPGTPDQRTGPHGAYSTVIADWGSSYYAASQLGPKARCLVDPSTCR